MIGLTKSGPASAAALSASDDHASHRSSSVSTSSRTLLSTRVPTATRSAAACERHDLVRRHADVAAPKQSPHQLAPAGSSRGDLADHDAVVLDIELELDFRARA